MLIPKKEIVRHFLNLRQINLITFTNKIISKVIHRRKEKAFHKIISNNQIGFMHEGQKYCKDWLDGL